LDAYTFFFILLLSLVMGLGGLYVPLIGLVGVFVSIAVILPNIPALITDPSYMLFAMIIVFTNCALLFVGYRGTKEGR